MVETMLMVGYVVAMVGAVRVLFQGAWTPDHLPSLDAQPEGWRGDEDWFWFDPDLA